MEQSANPAARVGHYTRKTSTSTENASVWLLTAAAPSDNVFRALCTYSLTYLLMEMWRSSNSTTFELQMFSTDPKSDQCFTRFGDECKFIGKIHILRLISYTQRARERRQTCFSQIQHITQTTVTECVT